MPETPVLFAEQLAVLPPLLPVQDQLQGPVPVTDPAVPVAQRLVVGAVETVVLFELLQVPLTGVAGVPPVPATSYGPHEMVDAPRAVPRISAVGTVVLP